MWQLDEPMRRDPARRPYAPTTVTARDLTGLVWRAVAITAGVGVVGYALGAHVPLPLAGLLALAALVAARVVRAAAPPPTEPPLPRAQADPRPADRPVADVTRMEDRLAWGRQDLDHFDRAVRPVLARLADERLRRHGITRASHPEQARRLLGEQLWRLGAGPSPAAPGRAAPGRAAKGPAGKDSGPTPAQLTPLVEQLERL